MSHAHTWQDSRTNQWDLAIEQRCACGEHRWRWYTDILRLDNEMWHAGKYPAHLDDETKAQFAPSHLP